MRKRINNEICKLVKKYNNINISKTKDECIIKLNINDYEIGIVINTHTYPFRSPRANINDNNYNDFLRGFNIEKYEKITNSNICPCCNSLLCENNWNITIGICQIINEIEKNLEIYNKILSMD